MGPTTFISYVKGVFINLKGSIQLQADDIALVYGEKDPLSLKQAIEADQDINTSKTKYIQFQGRARLEYFTQRSLNIIMLGNEKLDRVDSYKYLGMIIDACLTFNSHWPHQEKDYSHDFCHKACPTHEEQESCLGTFRKSRASPAFSREGEERRWVR